MIKLSDREWKSFKLNDKIFSLYSSINSTDFSKIKKGGDEYYPFITRTEKNNGIAHFVSRQVKKFNKCNVLIIGLDTQTVFYQPFKFYTGQNVQIFEMNNVNMNKYIALFIKPLLQKQLENLNWGGNGATLGRLRKKKVMLPVDNNGNPDYDFMEQYTKEKYFNLKLQTKEKQKHEINDWRGLNEVEWMDFQINKLFYNKIGKNIDGNKVDKQNGKVPYVTRKESNNGLDGFIYNDKRIEEKLNISQNPVITIGNETARPFVQNYDFFTGTKVNILQPIATINIFSLRFISKMLEQQKKKYSYSFTINSRRLKKQKIKLPTKNNQPDYKFMEQYMKRKENEVLEKI
ncbi:restriction endonuclease subunit S [Staphylococcus saprophyticus]|nr:restriction endonuclease subunit S [Staphylococcus saprophyticus]